MHWNRVFALSAFLLIMETGCSDHKSAGNKKDAPQTGSQNAEKGATTEQGAPAPSQKEPKPSAAPSSTTPAAKSDIKEESTATEDAASKVSARFSDGHIIRQADVLRKIQLLPGRVQQLPFIQLFNLILFVMIQEDLSYIVAKREHFEEDPEFKEAFALMKDGILQQSYLEQASRALLTQQAVQDQYQIYVKGFKPELEVGLKHVLVKNEEEAKSVIARLKKGEDLKSIQVELSLDKKTLDSEGFLGFFKKSGLPKDAADSIMGTSVGECVSVPIAIPPRGYSVLVVSATRMSAPVSLGRAKEHIESILLKKLALKEVDRLYSEHKVVKYDPSGAVIAHKNIEERLAALQEQRSGKIDMEEEKKHDKLIDQLTADTVVASFKLEGKEIKVKFDEVGEFVRQHPFLFRGLGQYEVYITACDEFLNQKLLSYEAKKAGIENLPAVKEKIKELEHSILARSYLELVSDKKIKDEDLKKMYNELKEKRPVSECEYRLRVIPVKSKEEGESVIKALKTGQTFDFFVAKIDKDNPFAQNSGDLGYLAKKNITELSSELESMVVKAPKGTVLPRPVDVNGQMVVVRLADKRLVEFPSFSAIKDQLRGEAKNKEMVAVTLEWLNQEKVEAYGFNGAKLDLSRAAIEKTLRGGG
jgi:parvulin-like peptidyl-prolyl isomerase